MKKIIIGAGNITYDGWISTQANELNLLDEETFKNMLEENSVDAFLAEHVFEHLTFDEGIKAAKIIYKYLKKNGRIRVAVPDANFRNEWYQNMCKPGGPGPMDHPAFTHKVFYDYHLLIEVFTLAGFTCKLLEWCDDNGDFHFNYYNLDYGKIGRSLRFDTRNMDGKLGMVSLIIDAIK